MEPISANPESASDFVPMPSAKFEKGLDPNLAMEAMNRACQLVEELGVGEVVGGAVDIYPVKREGVKIPFEPDKYNKLLGTDIPAGDMIG